MKPEVSSGLDDAKARLAEAQAAQSTGMSRIAAREAYLAALQAVRALIFQAEGKVVKTHSGARSEIHRLFRNWPPVSSEALSVLNDGFEQKTLADYGPVTGLGIITKDDADITVRLAGLLIDQIAAALVDTPQTD